MSSKGSTTRALAAEAVDLVLSRGMNLESAFSELGFGALPDRDQSLIKALAYGTLRTQLRNQAILDQLLTKPLRKKDRVIAALLSVGLFALLDSQRPDYAVVSATVSAVDDLQRKHMRGLVNAVLRRFLREREELLAKADSAVAQSNHPQWLLEKLQQDWPDNWQQVVVANNKQGPMWVRVNLAQLTANEWLQRCSEQEVSAVAAVKTVPSACLLATPVPVAELPGFAEGDCSVQDVASQIPAMLLAAEPGMRVLDACAAPGGKAGHILESCPEVDLTALDSDIERLERVEENFERLRLSATVVCGDAAEPNIWWDGEAFDRILLDAPCSATGVIRRHPDIRFLRRAGDIDALAVTQLGMLRSLWSLLKPGGRLLYSTCSVFRAENEQVIAAFLEEADAATEVPLKNLLDTDAPAVKHGLQLLPGQADNDGFYYALLEKSA